MSVSTRQGLAGTLVVLALPAAGSYRRQRLYVHGRSEGKTVLAALARACQEAGAGRGDRGQDAGDEPERESSAKRG